MTDIHVNIAYPRITLDGLKYFKENNLQIEFYFSATDMDEITLADITALKKEVAANDLKVTVHAPFYDLNLGAVDKCIREITLKRLNWTIDTAAELGAEVVVIHPGYWPFKTAANRNSWLENAKPGVLQLAAKAQEKNLKIAFENVFDRMPSDLKELVLMADSPNVGICFDVGHYNIFSALSLREWFEVLGEHIFECHIHDNDESADQHRPLGTGTLNFIPFVDWYKSLPEDNKPILTIEHQTKSYIPITLAYLRGVGI